MLKTAVIQTNAGRDKKAGLTKALGLVLKAIEKGAKFIALPEVFAFRGAPGIKNGLSPFAERIPGTSTLPLMTLAKEHKVHILAGTVLERARNSHKVYNTSVLIGPNGMVEAKYRKKNLFNARIGQNTVQESRYLLAGRNSSLAKVYGFKVGLSICYDLRFPEIYRSYARQGAHVLCVPSAFTKKTGAAHWEPLLRARAIENMCYVLAPNQTGKDSRGIPSYGNSMIIGPWGDILARASADRTQVIFADLDMRKIEQCRRILPSIRRARN